MKVAVIGAGSWGSALAIHLVRSGCQVALWAREEEVVEGIRKQRRNPLFLSEAEFPHEVVVDSDLAVARNAEAVLFVVPVQHARSILSLLRPHLGSDTVVVSASKGIEVATLQRMDEVVCGTLDLPRERFVALSGPSFAAEVAAGLPAAAVLAGHDREVLRSIQQRFSTASFRFYTSPDVIGVELAGALKNVIAIAAGMATGLELGRNTQAAVLTRGLHEITRLGVRLGGREETFRGLAGMGDLVLTCSPGSPSRNRLVGERLGRGETLAEATAGREVAEGVPTTKAAARLARQVGVEMPVTFAVEAILDGKLDPRSAVVALMTRELKEEAAL
jgi:glycerol-3-phosphate dehydrogenase (NAD(P)+)